jgi:galactitol-specific phosphotransferase system IIB component
MGKQTDKQIVEYNGIVCSANFHREFASDTDTALIISRLNHIKEDKQKLVNILKSIIE